jgi:hypothetical protein
MASGSNISIISGSSGVITGTITGTGTFGPMSGSGIWIDPKVQAELDRLQELIEAVAHKAEFLEVEARYWHIKSEKLEKLLAKALNVTE